VQVAAAEEAARLEEEAAELRAELPNAEPERLAVPARDGATAYVAAPRR